MPTNLPSKNQLQRQLSRDFEALALRLRTLAPKYRAREDYDLEAWCYDQAKSLTQTAADWLVEASK